MIEAMDTDASKSTAKPTKMSLILTPKVKKEKCERDSAFSLPTELQTLLSNLYMNATSRLCLTYPLRCAKDLSFCHLKHYDAPMPELPCQTQTANLKLTWQQGRYVEFIQMASDMCVRCEFPGECIFANLLELILTTSSPKQVYVSFVRVFRLYIHTFPPCWLAIRSHYTNFLTKSLQIPKLSTKKDNDPLSKSCKVFDLMFTLLEYTLDDYAKMIDQMTEDPDMDASNCNLNNNQNKSQSFIPWNWEDCNSGGTEEFFKLKPDARLERINIVMDLLLQILEIDLTMWMLHYYRKPTEYVFHTKKRPLVMIVFEMTMRVCSTTQVQRLFELFSRSVAMDLSRTHLKIMERCVTLIMAASQTADIETSIMGIRYPCFTDITKNLIKDFYHIFKSQNKTSVKPFLTVIEMLRLPYVKFEFIDNFLQIFDFPADIPMSPAKVVSGLARKNWSKYKCANEIFNSEDDISREQFFDLLLKALNAYCTMHGLLQVMRCITAGETVSPFQTVYESVHHKPNQGRTSDVFDLEKMSKDKDCWQRQLRIQVRMTRPKINLPIADMCIDKEVLERYRYDLKHCWELSDIINKLTQLNPDIELDKWLEFANMFKIEAEVP